MVFFTWLQGLLLLFQTGLLLPVGYLVLLTFAAWKAAGRKRRVEQGKSRSKFLILIPAHNEEKLLPVLLRNLADLDYPADHFSVHVIADNCTDQTALVAQQMGAVVHQRTDLEKRGKGYALQWALDKLLKTSNDDAVVILDADSVVSTNFLAAADFYLTQGSRVLQAYYTVRSPLGSGPESIRYIALAGLHYLRPLGRMVLGGSAGLKGNGMIFATDLLRRFPWSASVTEDIEQHMKLLLAGERVIFVPDAVVQGQMPDNLSRSKSQHDRWESGRVEMARRYVPDLARKFWLSLLKRDLRESVLYLDALVEHVIPPFSILALFAGLDLLAAVLLFAGSALGFLPGGSPLLLWLGRTNLILSAGVAGGMAFYVFSGLQMVKAPREIYRAFIFVPLFVLWKVKQVLGVYLGHSQQEWVRTTRNEG
jgi:1,2-diacylglycerol 3-beta-glucosyltransferase